MKTTAIDDMGKEGLDMLQNLLFGFSTAAGVVITLYFTVKWAVKRGIEEAVEEITQGRDTGESETAAPELASDAG